MILNNSKIYNNQPYQAPLHEDGILKTILDIMADSTTDGFEFLRDISNRILGNKTEFEIKHNLADAAKGLTATFPVLVTEATQLEHAVMVSKSIERKAIALLQMLFAANQITNATNAKAYLRRFHHNIDDGIDLSGMGVDDVIDYANSVTEEVAPGNYEQKARVNQIVKAICESVKYNSNQTIDYSINPVAIHEYTCHGSLNEVEVWATDNSYEVKREYRGDPDSLLGQLGPDKTVITSKNNNAPDVNDLKAGYEILNKGIVKTDVAKANESVPSLMIINFVSLVPGTQHKVVSTAVIGVKAVLHYVSSEDLVNRVIMKNSDKHGLLNFLRATTGEIKFFKDFLFAVDRAKVDAIGRSGKGSNSKIWKLLELRATQGQLNKASGHSNTDCAAITTMVVNQSEVDLIKKHHRIDLSKPGTMLGIMRGYNMMCGVIVDEVSEKVQFLYDDSSKDFETLSFMSLEREDGNGQLKKVINLLASKR